jgi:outer membrane immunogenic protein
MKLSLIAGAVALGTATAFLGTAAVAGSAGPATLDPIVPPPVAPMPTARNWAGGYAGVGLTFGTTTYDQATLPAFWPNGRGAGLSGLAGYNWQSGAVVYGVEGHLGAARMRGSTPIAGTTVTTDMSALGSLRGRVGVTQDSTLLFVTAGLAGARVTHTAAGLGSESRTLTGAVVGAGFEQALAGGMNLRGDLEHYRFSGRDFTTAGLPFPDVRSRANVARLSAVFRF